MSEKAACPRCDAYLSVVYYEGRHPDCGWNCRVRYEVRVEDYSDGAAREVVMRGLKEKPDQALREQVRNAALALGISDPDLDITVTVDDYAPRHMTPWLDPDAETPAPLSQRQQRANLKALRERYEANARASIDARLPS